MKKLILLFFTCCFAWLVCVLSVRAVPIEYVTQQTTGQDPMACPWTHELGNQFPPGELIISSWQYTEYIPCEWGDSPIIPNVEVTMTNLTGKDWYCPTYVKDPETTIANWDKLLINGQLAFTIDWLGINKPLVFESMVWDNIFQAGETWKFVIADYSNVLGLAPSAFGSWDSVNNIGRVGNQSGGDPVSSGSIIVCIPEPATLLLLAIGGLALLQRNRK